MPDYAEACLCKCLGRKVRRESWYRMPKTHSHVSHALKVLFTRLPERQVFSILNISGLALGIAVSIILLLILRNDPSYDKHHRNHKRIYRLGGHLQATGIDVRLAQVARELGPVLQEEFSAVQAVVRAIPGTVS